MMIEAVMYGITLSAKILIRSIAPPANMFILPSMPPSWLAKSVANWSGSMPGSGI